MALTTDSSTNNFQLTAYGNTLVVAGSGNPPFGGGSAYFDGSGDYLKLNNPPTNLINWFDSDFTIEAWVYLSSAPTNTPSNSSPLIGNADIFNSTEYWTFGPTNSLSVKFKYWSGSENSLQTSASVISTGQWYHLAFVKYGTRLSIYINGVENVHQTLSVTPLVSDSYPLAIGNLCGGGFNGYIDDLRITKGIARYTANFTPPTQQLFDPSDPYQDNVSLLLHMDNLSGSQTFIDSSSNNFTLSAFGNTYINSTTKKFGNGAAYFDGSGDYLQLVATDAFNFYNTNYTVEMWVYSTTSQSGGGLISTRIAAVYSPWELQITSSNKIGFLIRGGGSAWYLSGPVAGNTTISQNQWTHIAWVCNGSNTTVYVNGVADSNLTNLNTPILESFAQPSNIYIGKGGDGDFNGYIDELRVTKGVARYIFNFVPQTAPFANPLGAEP